MAQAPRIGATVHILGGQAVKPLRVGLDARLLSGTRGGIEQVIIGLAHGLSQLTDGEEEYLFLTYADSDTWLRPYVGGPCRVLTGPAAPRLPAGAMPRQLRPVLRFAFHYLSPLLGRRSVPVPRSEGTLEQAGVTLVHFTTQNGFLTNVPSLYQPWDLQHRHLPQFFTPRERLAREILYRTFCEQAAVVVAASVWGKHDLMRHYGLPPSKIVVVPGAPVLTAYRTPSSADLAAIRHKFALPEAFLFYPAQTWPHKNHIGLLEALAHLRDQRQLIIPLVCSGSQNDFFPRIMRRVHDLDLEQQVQFVGFVSPLEVRCLYQLCRGLIFPTQFEGLGLPLLEAMLANVPVASSNVTCLPEQAGGAALLFDPHEPEALVAAIHRLWTDEPLRRILVERGKRNAARFSWGHTARLFRAYYRRLTNWTLTGEDRELLAASEANLMEQP
jgi:glycosyltransferase involved in cell wall biosynthesis